MPATQNDDGHVQSAAPATNNATHLLKTLQGYYTCRTKQLWTHYETCWNVTKYHTCHVKLGYATFETSKSDHFCRTRHRHGHSDLIVNGCQRLLTVADGCRRLPTAADGCRRLRSQKRRRANTSPPPDPQSKTRTVRYAFGNKSKRHSLPCIYLVPLTHNFVCPCLS